MAIQWLGTKRHAKPGQQPRVSTGIGIPRWQQFDLVTILRASQKPEPLSIGNPLCLTWLLFQHQCATVCGSTVLQLLTWQWFC